MRCRSTFALAVALLSASLTSAHTRITTDLTWSEDVRAVLRQHCMRCHSPGGLAPSYVDLTTYGDDSAPGARAWATAIEEEVRTGRMPPWQADARFDGFENSRRLTQEEIDTIVGWVEGGAPQGPRRDLPPPREFTAGAWELGEPDLVVTPDGPLGLAAGKSSDVVSVTVPVELDEAVWVTGYEFRPAAPQVLYRAEAWIHDAEAEPEVVEVEVQVPYDPFRPEDEPEPTRPLTLPQGTRFLGQWLRGDAPVLLPEGMGVRLAPGARIELRLRYQRSDDGAAAAVDDQTRLGLFFAKDAWEVDLVTDTGALQPAGKKERKRDRPPGAAPLLGFLELPTDARIVALQPQREELLEDFEVRATFPDGRGETLLLVEDYDPRWPASFWLRQPLQAKKGTRLELRGVPRADRLDVAADASLLNVTYAINDHLVLPPPPPEPRQSVSRGGMLLGGDLDNLSAGAAGPDASTDPRAAAHMDHSPLHGGQFFMASNQYHHVEGALPDPGVVRIYVYDDFKKPIDPRNFDGDVVFERWDDKAEEWVETRYDLTPGPLESDYLEGEIPEELPAEFFAHLWLAGEQVRFDFYFEEPTVEPDPAELLARRALNPHSHVRPPLDIPEAAADVVRELEQRTALLRTLIDREEWLALHVPAFDAMDLAEALLAKPGDLSARQHGSVRQAIGKLRNAAALLDAAGDTADAGRVRREFGRYMEAARAISDAYGG